MIQELLYTSHKGKGLRPGSGGGFCTVVCTQGMPVNVVRRLEQLSGYKHPFDIHDPRSSKNPVNYRSMPLVLGGTSYVILSRVADVRGEHTGRSNKLAHHVILSDDEFVDAGPADVLGQPGAVCQHWDGEVKEVLPRRSLSISGTQSGPCVAWKKVAGDSGWAGVVAEALAAKPSGNAARVIFPLGTDCLPLCREVYSLTAPSKRWKVSFSTYATESTSPCHLNFVLDGTREATMARKDPRRLVVDLCKELGNADSSDFVNAARSGDIEELHEKYGGRMKRRRPIAKPRSRAQNPKSEEYGLVTVSYTHLTLPTICSV